MKPERHVLRASTAALGVLLLAHLTVVVASPGPAVDELTISGSAADAGTLAVTPRDTRTPPRWLALPRGDRRAASPPAAEPPPSGAAAEGSPAPADAPSAEPADDVAAATPPETSDRPVVTYAVEVEPATGLDPAAVVAQVDAALLDPRSWTQVFDLQRVESGARITVLVATPDTVDRLCAAVGLNTAGYLSCWTGSTAAINLDRWNLGTRQITDIDLYRAYVVNHEVGHGLGRRHEPCPGVGATAPVMQQQTKSLDGCTANPWPFPGPG